MEKEQNLGVAVEQGVKKEKVRRISSVHFLEMCAAALGAAMTPVSAEANDVVSGSVSIESASVLPDNSIREGTNGNSIVGATIKISPTEHTSFSYALDYDIADQKAVGGYISGCLTTGGKETTVQLCGQQDLVALDASTQEAYAVLSKKGLGTMVVGDSDLKEKGGGYVEIGPAFLAFDNTFELRGDKYRISGEPFVGATEENYSYGYVSIKVEKENSPLSISLRIYADDTGDSAQTSIAVKRNF